MKIYLDDVRTPKSKDWTVVRNYDEFVQLIDSLDFSDIELISLDHDLGDSAMAEYFTNVRYNYILNYDNINEKTGYHCAKYLVKVSMEKEVPLPLVYTHSHNPIGSANIIGYVNNYLMNCQLPKTCKHKEVPFKIPKD